jgi:hypothetical protein
MPKMISADAAWCRHFGKRGKDGDQERRNIKRGKKNDWKRAERKGQN